MAKKQGIETEQSKKSGGKEEPIFTANQELIIDAYRKKKGSITSAMKSLDLVRETFYYNINNFPAFEKKIREIDAEILSEKKARTEEMLDFAEEELYFQIKGQYTFKPKYDLKTGLIIPDEYELDQDGEPIRVYKNPPSERLLIAFLEMKGKDRGYTKRTDLKFEGDSFSGVKINIVNQKPRSQRG